jgi:putative oxidoreductase
MDMQDTGLLLLRASVGGTIAVHGIQKLFGWFDGPGLDKAAGGFEHMGFTPGRPHALAAALTETVGGSMIALGVGSRAGAGAAGGNMAVASSVHAPKGFFAANGGMEHPAGLTVGAAAIALLGPGDISLDRLIGHRLARPWMGAIGLVAAAAGAAAFISRMRRNQQQPPTPAAQEEVDLSGYEKEAEPAPAPEPVHASS